MTSIVAPLRRRRPKHRAPGASLRQFFADRATAWLPAREVEPPVTDVPRVAAAAFSEPVPVSEVTWHDRVRAFATDSRLYGYDERVIREELFILVPDLHPAEARDRFRAVQDACEGLRNVKARLTDQNPAVAEAAKAALRYHEELVEAVLGRLLRQSIAFNDAGSAWTRQDTLARAMAEAVAA